MTRSFVYLLAFSVFIMMSVKQASPLTIGGLLSPNNNIPSITLTKKASELSDNGYMSDQSSSSSTSVTRIGETEFILKKRYNSSNDIDPDEIPIFYDLASKITFIEKLFGEPFHVDSTCQSRLITWQFCISVSLIYVVEGSLTWLWIAVCKPFFCTIFFFDFTKKLSMNKHFYRSGHTILVNFQLGLHKCNYY